MLHLQGLFNGHQVTLHYYQLQSLQLYRFLNNNRTHAVNTHILIAFLSIFTFPLLFIRPSYPPSPAPPPTSRCGGLPSLLSGSVQAISCTLCCRPWRGISYRCVCRILVSRFLSFNFRIGSFQCWQGWPHFFIKKARCSVFI